VRLLELWVVACHNLQRCNISAVCNHNRFCTCPLFLLYEQEPRSASRMERLPSFDQPGGASIGKHP
jgi:hypothetical protein